MSDPFSVAGSAVGVISLGLFVCGEIVQYAQNVQGQNDDMRYLMTKATNVRLLMRDLRGLIEEKRYDLPEVAADLESKALDLKVYLDRLSAKIQQYGLLPSHIATKSAHSRAKSTIKKAFYPFRKETLFEIRDCLESMEMDLEAALTVFSARELHRLGLKQDIFGLKQDLLIEKMDTLQLSITTTTSSTPHQTTFQQPRSLSKVSCSETFRIQRSRAPLIYNWENAQAKQTKKQYSFYSRLLRRTFTGTFYLSTGPGFFSILPSLHCHAVVGIDSWLCTMLEQMADCLLIADNDKLSSVFMTKTDDWIQQFQLAVSEGKVRPTDELLQSRSYHFSSSYALVDFPFQLLGIISRDMFPGVSKFVTYMLDHGVVTNHQNEYSILRRLCISYIWASEEENQLARFIIERCGPINWAPAYWTEKRNMQSLLANGQDDLIDLPPGYMAALRESEEDLRALLESNLASSEDSVDGITLLQITMGWPAGIKLLMLRPQSGTQFPDKYHRGTRGKIFGITDQDSRIKEYVDSCKILLEAGYRFSHCQIIKHSSKILRSAFISELATRRRKLLDVAKAQINPSELSNLRGEETGLPDISASKIWASLMTKGHKIDQSLRPSEENHLLCLDGDPEILMELYEAGFTDLDQTHPDGYTPLMIYCDKLVYGWPRSTPQGIAWMISKGANPSRELPNSNTTTIHLFNQRLADSIYYGEGRFDLYIELRPLQQIGFPLLSTSPRDSCSCSCSVGGCTPLSVAMREVAYWLDPMYMDLEKGRSRFQLSLRTIIEYNQSKSEVCHAMIRFLTFDGLGLSHTCCTELRYPRPWEYTRDEYELQEIRDEQKIAAKRFEKLVAEFGSQFDALGLPLMEFLQEVWYKRMIQFLSERDNCDPEHHKGTRRLGIFLETDEIEIPLVVKFICDRVTVVDDDSEGS